MDFCHLQENIKKQLLDTGLDAVKSTSKAGEFSGKEIADAVTKSNDGKIVKPNGNRRNVEEIINPLEKRDEILYKLRKVL